MCTDSMVNAKIAFTSQSLNNQLRLALVQYTWTLKHLISVLIAIGISIILHCWSSFLLALARCGSLAWGKADQRLHCTDTLLTKHVTAFDLRLLCFITFQASLLFPTEEISVCSFSFFSSVTNCAMLSFWTSAFKKFLHVVWPFIYWCKCYHLLSG